MYIQYVGEWVIHSCILHYITVYAELCAVQM